MRRFVTLLAIALSACTFSISLDGDAGALPAVFDAPKDTVIDGHAIDAPIVDAVLPIDAGPDAAPTWVVVETMTIPCSGTTTRTSQTVLAATTYRLRAIGECITNSTSNSRSDAEYYGYNFTTPQDATGTIDIGLAVNDTTPGLSTLPDWGSYASNHRYEVPWMGLGAAIVVEFHDPDTGNNAGSLTLEILAFQ